MHGYLEGVALIVEQEHAVQQATGEGEEMAETIAQARGAAEGAAQISTRSARGGGRRQHEIQT